MRLRKTLITVALLLAAWSATAGIPRTEAQKTISGICAKEPLRTALTGVLAVRADGDTLAAVWAVMPVLETLCRIPRPSIVVDADFNAPNAVRLDAEIGLTLRVWALLFSLRPLLALLPKETPEHP